MKENSISVVENLNTRTETMSGHLDGVDGDDPVHC